MQPKRSLPAVVEALDKKFLECATTGAENYVHLLAAQRKLGLVHDDRPICPFLRPHILSRSEYTKISEAAEIIAGAFEKLVTHALSDEALMSKLGLTPAEEKLARVDPGYSCLCVSSRLDAFLTESGFQFLEYNAETPAGVADQMQLEKLLFELPEIREFLSQHRHWRPQPHVRLLNSLVEAYREWGGAEERPQIAIVDWEGVSTASEFILLKDYFESQGYETVISDPRALEYDGKYLHAHGTRIDILYKRVLIHELLARFDDSHPMARAVSDHRVCMANSFRTKIAHKKSGFAILSDPQYAAIFSPLEIKTINEHIPWTRTLKQGSTSFHGHSTDLQDILTGEQEHLVLKPNDDYGGHGVIIGWETSRKDWNQAIARGFELSYVAQERVPVRKVCIPKFTEGVSADQMIVDFDPFLFNNQVEGGLVRLSQSSLCNVSSGGGETALVVLEDF